MAKMLMAIVGMTDKQTNQYLIKLGTYRYSFLQSNQTYE